MIRYAHFVLACQIRHKRMSRDSFALEYAEREEGLAARVRLGVLFRAGQVEDQVGLDQGPGGDV